MICKCQFCLQKRTKRLKRGRKIGKQLKEEKE